MFSKPFQQNAQSFPSLSRSYIAFPLVLGTLAATLFCMSQVPHSTTANIPVRDEPTIHTFTIPPIFTDELQDLCYHLPVRNNTSHPVHFTAIQKSCSCAAAHLDKASLAPGEETRLRCEIDLRHRSGPQRFACRLLQDGAQPWTYFLETTLLRKYEFSGSNSINLGAILPHSQPTANFTLSFCDRSHDHLPNTISLSGDPRLQFHHEPPDTARNGDDLWVRTFPLRVLVRPEKTHGPTEARFHATFRLQGEGGRLHSLDASVSWTVVSPYKVSPSELYFGVVSRRSQPITRKVAIRITDGSCNSLQARPSANRALDYTLESAPNSSVITLVLILDPKKLTSSLAESLVLYEPNGLPAVKIPVAAILDTQNGGD